MNQWVVYASIHSTHRIEPEVMTHLDRTLNAFPGAITTAVPGGISLRLSVAGDQATDAYLVAMTVLTQRILPEVEPAHLTDLRINAADTSCRATPDAQGVVLQ